MPNNQTNDPTVKLIAGKATKNIERISLKSSIPLISSHKQVLQIIKAYHDKYVKLTKSFKGRRNDEKYKVKIWSFSRGQ